MHGYLLGANICMCAGPGAVTLVSRRQFEAIRRHNRHRHLPPNLRACVRARGVEVAWGRVSAVDSGDKGATGLQQMCAHVLPIVIDWMQRIGCILRTSEVQESTEHESGKQQGP
jgi:hypothetical protein